MNTKLTIKFIKYNLNLAGLCWMLFITDLSYALFTGSPDCTQGLDIIIRQIPKLASFYIFFLLGITGFNYLFERYIEKKKNTKEFLTILLIQSLGILAIAYSVSHLYYTEHCP